MGKLSDTPNKGRLKVSGESVAASWFIDSAIKTEKRKKSKNLSSNSTGTPKRKEFPTKEPSKEVVTEFIDASLEKKLRKHKMQKEKKKKENAESCRRDSQIGQMKNESRTATNPKKCNLQELESNGICKLQAIEKLLKDPDASKSKRKRLRKSRFRLMFLLFQYKSQWRTENEKKLYKKLENRLKTPMKSKTEHSKKKNSQGSSSEPTTEKLPSDIPERKTHSENLKTTPKNLHPNTPNRKSSPKKLKAGLKMHEKPVAEILKKKKDSQEDSADSEMIQSALNISNNTLKTKKLLKETKVTMTTSEKQDNVKKGLQKRKRRFNKEWNKKRKAAKNQAKKKKL